MSNEERVDVGDFVDNYGDMDHIEAAQKIMPDANFNSFLDASLDGLRKQVKKDKPKTFSPVAIVLVVNLKEREMEHLILTPQEVPESLDERTELFEELGAKIARERPESVPILVQFIAEAWMTNIKKGDKQIRPSQANNKIECITAFAMTVDDRVNMASDEIVRKNGVITLKPKMYAPYKKGVTKMETPHLQGFFTGWANYEAVGRYAQPGNLRELEGQVAKILGGDFGWLDKEFPDAASIQRILKQSGHNVADINFEAMREKARELGKIVGGKDGEKLTTRLIEGLNRLETISKEDK